MVMKFKIRIIFVLVLTLSLLTACSTDKNYIKEKSITDIKTNTQDTRSNEAVKVNIKDKSSPSDNPIEQANPNVKKLGEIRKVNTDNNKKNYKIKSLSYNRKDVYISFPSVAGLSDTKKQSKINKILKEEALVVLNDFMEVQQIIYL